MRSLPPSSYLPVGTIDMAYSHLEVLHTAGYKIGAYSNIMAVHIIALSYMYDNDLNKTETTTWCVFCRRRGVDIRSAFDMYDLSKTGFVSRRDFREAMRKLQV